jgi:hypothetical protein
MAVSMAMAKFLDKLKPGMSLDLDVTTKREKGFDDLDLIYEKRMYTVKTPSRR